MKSIFYKTLRVQIIVLISLLASCSEPEMVLPSQPKNVNSDIFYAATPTASLYEDFEGGTKTSYSASNVALSTGSWTLTDALIGTSTSDIKTGTKSVRMVNTGRVSMNFTLASGASKVTVLHAKYGSDATSTWELWMSLNSGAYTKVGSTVTTSSTSLQMATFTMSVSGAVKFEIRKVSGGSARINIDEVNIEPYVTSGGGTTTYPDNTSLTFGNPSLATNSVTNENNYLMDKPYFALSYNRSRATANWVSWYVGSSSLGSAARQDDFRADTSLPSGWYQAGSTSYSGSGFDRGHNCPSADRTSTIAANSATFLMTNMIPQAPRNNQQTWANLEDYIRTQVKAGFEAYVIMGAYGRGGTGSNGTAQTINNGNIVVPSNVWKVVILMPTGNNDVNRVTTSTRVIAVNTPNINTISTTWGSYRTSVDAIEAATGYNILSNLPDNIEAVLEARVDTGATN